MKMLPQQRLLARAAAILLVISLLTGIYLAAAMTGKISADPGTVVAAHIGAFLGCFWMIGLGWSMPMLGYGDRGLTRLAWVTIVPTYFNWLITSFKALWKVRGVEATGDSHNDTIFALLTVLVVIPSFVGSIGWVYGLFRKPADAR
jgi:(hydroxyamino)benzene mutase